MYGWTSTEIIKIASSTFWGLSRQSEYFVEFYYNHIIKGKRSQELKACYIISSEFCAVNKKEQEKTVFVFFSLLR